MPCIMGIYSHIARLFLFCRKYWPQKLPTFRIHFANEWQQWNIAAICRAPSRSLMRLLFITTVQGESYAITDQPSKLNVEGSTPFARFLKTPLGVLKHKRLPMTYSATRRFSCPILPHVRELRQLGNSTHPSPEIDGSSHVVCFSLWQMK